MRVRPVIGPPSINYVLSAVPGPEEPPVPAGRGRAGIVAGPWGLRRFRGGETVIEVQHITKRYGGVTAVDDVSFRVEQGEILGFLGPNGAGKTTTMRILTGYMPPTDGKATVAGFDVFTHAVDD